MAIGGEKLVIKALEIVGKGLEKGTEILKEGGDFEQAMKGGFEATKETALKEWDKILSPENQQKLTESSEKLDDIQDKLQNESETVEANPAEEIKGTNDVAENLNDVAKEINEKSEPGFLSGIKEGLQEFKEVLKEIQEVQDKLKELGVNPDLFTMLSAEALEIDEMEDLEEEGEGTE
jgi:predicted phage tail protein